MKMPNHKLIDLDNPFTAGAISLLATVLFLALLNWMNERDLDHETATRCPHPGPGQQLIGRGHIEADGHPGELMCTYSTAPVDAPRLIASSRL